MSYLTGLFSTLIFQEIKPQSHYNHGYNEIVSRKSHVDDYSTWDIVKATQWVDGLVFISCVYTPNAAKQDNNVQCFQVIPKRRKFL